MYDVHTHTFNALHLPDGYLTFGLVRLLRNKHFARLFNWALGKFGSRWKCLRRVRRFLIAQEANSQLDNFKRLVDLHMPQVLGKVDSVTLYPDTQSVSIGYTTIDAPKPIIVVHPMDFEWCGLGRVPVSVEEQVAEACSLEYRGVRPKVFLPVDPRRDKCVPSIPCTLTIKSAYSLTDWVEIMTASLPIAGLKLYPSLGFPLLDERLWPVYQLAQDRNLPIMCHFGGTTVRGRGVTAEKALELMSFSDVGQVLKAFPSLRWCCAHAGGSSVWADSWMVMERLSAMDALLWGRRNAYIDTSYVAFAPATAKPFQQWVATTGLMDQVLFGTDAPMTQIEPGYLGSHIKQFRERIGESRWGLITDTNPRRYLYGDEA